MASRIPPRTQSPFYQAPPGLPASGHLEWVWNPITQKYEQQASGGGLPLPARPTALPSTTTTAGLPNPAVSLGLNTKDAVAGGLSAAGGAISLFTYFVGKAIESSGAQNAAQTQANAANQAAALLAQAQRDALDFQKQQYAQSRSDLKPWLSYGTSAVNTLGNLMGLKPADIPDIPLTKTPLNANVGIGETGLYSRAGATGPPIPATRTGTSIPRPAGSVPPTGANALTRTYVPNAAAGATPQQPQTPGGVAPQRTGSTTGPSGTVVPSPQTNPPQGSYSGNAITVTVKWPDGSTTRIPTSQLARYVSLGAEPVGTSQQMPQQLQSQSQPTMGGMY